MQQSSPYQLEPLSIYRQMVREGKIEDDSHQRYVLEQLQSLAQALSSYSPKNHEISWLERLGLRKSERFIPQGIYIYGDVGRGKSFLMDLFYADLKSLGKKRIHFHAFMQDVHVRIQKIKMHHKDVPKDNVLKLLADELVAEFYVLCFDEFVVTDIVDAMILSKLFTYLFEAGLVMVATSNFPPQELYKNGIQRDRFLPFIDLLSKKLDLIELTSAQDYRLKVIAQENSFLVPNSQGHNEKILSYFGNLDSVQSEVLIIQGREIKIPYTINKSLYTEFKDLMTDQFNTAEFEKLATHFELFFVVNIPQFSSEQNDLLRRFMNFVDILYEHKCKLVASFSTTISELYLQGPLSFEFERTKSRLHEMQSKEYTLSAHLT